MNIKLPNSSLKIIYNIYQTPQDILNLSATMRSSGLVQSPEIVKRERRMMNIGDKITAHSFRRSALDLRALLLRQTLKYLKNILVFFPNINI